MSYEAASGLIRSSFGARLWIFFWPKISLKFAKWNEKYRTTIDVNFAIVCSAQISHRKFVI